MKTYKICFTLLPLIAAGFLAGCSNAPAKSPDISDSLRHSLDSAGLKAVSMQQDREKGVITLSGNVPSDSDKTQAESIAMSVAGGQVVANQIAVVPTNNAAAAKTVNSDFDNGIGENLDAALIQNNLRKNINFLVTSGVVTLRGDVASDSARAQAASVAASVPNVKQVVNELQVKNQKATSN
jgi:hyperosmotically inducible protein